ncbi:MAG: methylenetetrahydrofolate reductase [Gaiellaceae bacterium]|nr:methylenetetrahydrofolate reductase [Gaiellaceae bacterium]
MNVTELIATSRPCFSFEFFPPRDDAGVEQLLETMRLLRTLDPAFVSVTFGAGGSTRARTADLVVRLREEVGIEAMAHFSCVGSTRDELREALQRMRESGISSVLALRGDAPRDQADWTPAPGGLSHATDLVTLLTDEFDFAVGAACHPEKHPEAPDPATDLAYLRRKVDAGAEFLITQLFFDNASYFTFVQRAREAGIMVPIVPGIMPITNVEQIERFTKLCGAVIPAGLHEALERRRGNEHAVQDFGVAYATLQCAELLRKGAPGIHFYTLNRSTATASILRALRLHEPWRLT